MRTLIIAFVLLTFLNCETPAPQPNFLFIVADDLGHKDLSATGSEFYETPNIDRIAHEGTLFTQGYANASVCSPSRASLLTGLYPTVHGITDWIGAKYGTDWRKVGRKTQLLPSEYVKHLPFELTTLPEVFKTHQYKTFFAGKWHLGSVEQKSLPTDHGFEINKGGYHRGGPYSGGYFSPFNNPFLEDKPKEKGMTLSMKLARETTDFIKSNQEKPFFAYLSFYAVHAPIQTTQEKWLKYQKKAVDQGILEEGFSMEKRLPIRIKQDNPVYAGLLEQTDEAVGHILNTLDELKLDENTVVVFVSDNGGVSAGDDFATSNLPLRGGKGYQWEAGTRIPFFIKAPQIINPEKKINTPVTGADLFPTLLELASIKNTTPVDGKSLVPLMEKKSLGERSLFWHYPHYGNQGGDPSAIIRKGYWKLIHYFEDGKNELYQLGEDMGESTNVFDQNTELGIALKNELEQWLETTGAKIPEKDPLHNDEEEEKWLSQHKQKMKLKVEKRRAFQLDPNYLPNEDWWGSTVD
ncbi:MAG: sulfatase [Flavobacteriales bacterium]|nr:sulfatase [Candidatus Arcticimaribacter sp.]